jgi:hypothetical protein
MNYWVIPEYDKCPTGFTGVCRAFGLWMRKGFPASITHYLTILDFGQLQNVRLAHQNRAIEISAQTTEREQPTLGQPELRWSLSH